MATNNGVYDSILIRLHAIARKLEGEGQYNVAKLARAAADSLLRTAAYPIELPAQKEKLAGEVDGIAARLSDLEMHVDLVESLRAGASAIREGRLPMLEDTPHPFVCRTCGHVELDMPSSNCPRCNAWPRTFQRYLPVYWLDEMDPFEATNYLSQTPDDVMRLINGTREDDMCREVVVGEWSIRNVLAHLRDAQGVLDFRVNLLIEKDNPTIESKAVFEWAKKESERPASSMEIFDTYLASRCKTLETLRGIPLADWWRKGRHEEFGTISIKQQASYFATHELTHLPQIEFLRERLTAS
jgi:predicted Zn-ribbon and HTH transcriptional regulator